MLNTQHNTMKKTSIIKVQNTDIAVITSGDDDFISLLSD